MTIKIIHVGEINTNTHGTKMKIVRYGSNEDIDIEFLDEFHYIKEHQAYSNFKSGGVKNPYENLFSPKRWHPLASAGNFLTDIGVSVKGLLTGYHFFTEKKEEDLECGHGGIVRKGLRRYGCYRDEEGKLHRVDIRCTHMGCELLWNSEERTWDWPCHGSRFDYDGNLIDNPAKRSKGKE